MENRRNTETDNKLDSQRTKKYNSIKFILSLVRYTLTIMFILLVLKSGAAVGMVNLGWLLFDNRYLVLLAYIAILAISEFIVFLPLSYYSDYLLEIEYGLSNLTRAGWLWRKLKETAVSLVIIAPFSVVLYFFLRKFHNDWWIPVAAIYFVFTVVLNRIFPTLIFPLFYRVTPIQDHQLAEQIKALCDKEGVDIEGVYSFNLSSSTRRANAALVGWGKKRRIIISDTLLEKFEHEEILSVLAHELGHYVGRHTAKLTVISGIFIVMAMFFCAYLHKRTISFFGFQSVDELASIPLMALYLLLFSILVMPFQNAVSRAMERWSDRYALKQGPAAWHFISAMEKLMELNLEVSSPNPLIVLIFYSHPPISQRIEMARRFDNKKTQEVP